MTPRISIAVAGALLAAFGLFPSPPQSPAKGDPVEAARLNNLGAAYMNQQLFEKGLKSFRQAAELDPTLTMARLNEGIALLNMQKIDEARVALEDTLKQDQRTRMPGTTSACSRKTRVTRRPRSRPFAT